MVVGLIASGWVIAWLVPAGLFVLVLVAVAIGVRWVASQRMAVFRSVPLFAALSDHQLRSVLQSAQEVEFLPGAAIVREGDEGKNLYVIKRGTAKVSVEGEERATLEADGYFGEVSVLDRGPRTATVTAQDHLLALELSRSSFGRLLENDPALTRALFDRMCEWLRAAGEPVPGPDTQVDRAVLEDLAERLREAQHVDWGRRRAGRARRR